MNKIQYTLLKQYIFNLPSSLLPSNFKVLIYKNKGSLYVNFLPQYIDDLAYH